MQQKVRIPIQLFYDYGCPFSYIASMRLRKLMDKHPLQIRWRPVEVYPNNPAAGKPLEELGYTREEWQRENQTLAELAAAEGLPLERPDFSPNTRRALLLIQACMERRPESFLTLHEAIFRAYMVDGLNIGDGDVLWDVVRNTGTDDLLPWAWEEPKLFTGLLQHVETARELGLSAVPTLVVSGRKFTGAVSMDVLEQALEQHSLEGEPE